MPWASPLPFSSVWSIRACVGFWLSQHRFFSGGRGSARRSRRPFRWPHVPAVHSPQGGLPSVFVQINPECGSVDGAEAVAPAPGHVAAEPLHERAAMRWRSACFAARSIARMVRTMPRANCRDVTIFPPWTSVPLPALIGNWPIAARGSAVVLDPFRPGGSSRLQRTGSGSGRRHPARGRRARAVLRNARAVADVRHRTSKVACGQLAAQWLRLRVKGRVLRCTRVDTDRCGRVVARCSVDGADVGSSIVEAGWATAYRKYSLDHVGAERLARAARRGIWALGFQPPAAYRRARRAVSAPQSPQHARCALKGNMTSKGLRIYHLPGSRDYAAVRINVLGGEKWFTEFGAAGELEPHPTRPGQVGRAHPSRHRRDKSQVDVAVASGDTCFKQGGGHRVSGEGHGNRMR